MFWVFATGLGVGWIAGLSISSIVGTIMAALLGLVGALVTALQSVDDADRSPFLPRADPRPLAALTVGIALGASAGILARTHQVLAPAAPGSGGSAVFNGGDVAASPENDDYRIAVLFSGDRTECDEVRSAMFEDDETFRQSFRATVYGGEVLDSIIDDAERLRDLVRAIC